MTCTSVNETPIIDTRRAFGVWFIFFYAGYLAILALSRFLKDEDLRKNMKRMVDDIGFTHYFFVLLSLIAHTNTASPVAWAFWYVYVATFGLSFFGYFKEIPILPVAAYGIQLLLLFAIWLCLVIDDWCDFYIGRYVFN